MRLLGGLWMLAWLVRFIESSPFLHRVLLVVWKQLSPRMAAFFRGLLTTNWIVSANAVILDEDTDPPEILLVRHTYRTVARERCRLLL